MARQRQTLVSDMRITVTMREHAEGMTRPILHELKVINAYKSIYSPNSEARAVNVRSSKFQNEYLLKARGADIQDSWGGGRAGRQSGGRACIPRKCQRDSLGTVGK